MSPSIHDRARQLAAQKQIPLSEAYSALAKRRRKAKPGLHATRERPVRFWWQDGGESDEARQT